MSLRSCVGILAALHLLMIAGVSLQVEGKVGFGPGDQEWGYVTVNPQQHMFWWLYYTTSQNVTDVHDKPLIIWLQGGPGASSTGYGNFEELGPLDLNLNPRNYTWVKDYNVLFIDSPIGAGFSYTNDMWAFAFNNSEVASSTFECIRGFLIKLPKFETVPTYIVAESYGGKFAVELALIWNKAQKAGEIASNLQGVGLGDCSISPIDSALAWPSYLLDMGIVDTKGSKKIEEAVNKIKIAVDNGDWSNAIDLTIETQIMILNMTGNVNFHNVLQKVTTGRNLHESRNEALSKLMNDEVKKALGVNITWGDQRRVVYSALSDDIVKPVTNIVEMLLNETDLEIFVYTGQLDLIVPTAGTVVWVENLKWRNSTEWHEAARLPLVVDDVIEGYVKKYGKLKLYWIIRSGHMVPRDNPAATAAMLKHLTSKATFNGTNNKT